MTKDRAYAQQWWILSPQDLAADGRGDLDHLLEAVRSHDWVVFAARRDDPSAPPVALTIAKSADGRRVCTGLIVGLNGAYGTSDGTGSFGRPLEVTSRALRDIPIAELVGRAINDSDAPERHAAYRRLVEGRMPGSTDVQRSPGPKGHPEAHFAEVAELYKRALEADPEKPMTWLAAQFPDFNRSTVSRWVQQARDKGFLGASTPGRAGESTGDLA